MKFLTLIKELILEQRKKDILISKLGFDENSAAILSTLAGPFSILIANKIIKKIEYELKKWSREVSKETVLNHIKNFLTVRGQRQKIVTIIDWIRVGLNGNINQYKNLSFDELYNLSAEWHEKLNIGSGDINYIEENKIIRDYRKNNIGFYWVDLETNYSHEECERMGHCGRTNLNNTIYSLRETIKLNDNFTINKSHITSAIGKENGIIYQMKGQKNSKPKNSYHQYIIDLLINDKKITGFGSEYESSLDFKIKDLQNSEIEKLFYERPDLFDSRKLKLLLYNIGIKTGYKPPNMVFELNLSPDEIGNYVNGDYEVGRWKDKNGTIHNNMFIETLLSGDSFDLIDDSYYYDEWESALENECDEENENKIRETIKVLAGDEYNPEESLSNLIDEYDDERNIKGALGQTYASCASDSFYKHGIKKLTKALEYYGNVIELNDKGAKLKIDLDKIIDKTTIDDETLDEYFENCDDKLPCVLSELIGYDWIDKPDLDLNLNYWYPDINTKDFNEYLSELL